MSVWTHAICQACWNLRTGNAPSKILHPKLERCCFCGNDTRDGIYIRESPSNTMCGGVHTTDGDKT